MCKELTLLAKVVSNKKSMLQFSSGTLPHKLEIEDIVLAASHPSAAHSRIVFAPETTKHALLSEIVHPMILNIAAA